MPEDLGGGIADRTAARESCIGADRDAELVERLPIEPDVSARPAARGSANDTATGRRGVLIVDDNEDAAESLAMLVELMGHRAWTALDGAAALAAARAHAPDVVLLDVGLPDMDGYEVARQLRRRAETEHAFLVALTGYGQPEDRQRALAAGFDRHELKPLSATALGPLLAGHGDRR